MYVIVYSTCKYGCIQCAWRDVGVCTALHCTALHVCMYMFLQWLTDLQVRDFHRAGVVLDYYSDTYVSTVRSPLKLALSEGQR